MDASYPSKEAAVESPPQSNAFARLFGRVSQWRRALELPSPGTVEHLQKEVKSTQVNNVFMEGGRADLTKTLSMDPIFQVVHGFSLGSQSPVNPSLYSFGAVYATSEVFAHGTIDHEGNLNARFNNLWNPANTLKIQAQLSSQPGHNMLSLEHDYQSYDYSVNGKVINLWPADMSGVYIGSYLQSLTKNLALGFETMCQRQNQMSEFATSYLAKYTGANRNWIATGLLQPAGIFQATYWQRLSEKVEISADLQLVNAPGRRDALTTLATKYDLRLATFRAQLDSTGKVSAWLEQRFSPAFVFSVGGEIDHFKNSAKVGIGVQIESSPMSPEEMGMMDAPMIQ